MPEPAWTWTETADDDARVTFLGTRRQVNSEQLVLSRDRAADARVPLARIADVDPGEGIDVVLDDGTIVPLSCTVARGDRGALASEIIDKIRAIRASHQDYRGPRVAALQANEREQQEDVGEDSASASASRNRRARG